MNSIRLILGACLGLGLLSCGNGGTYSCDHVTGGSHSCSDTVCTSGDTSSIGSSCGLSGGTQLSECTHDGAVGGCKLNTKSGDRVCTITQWTYSGTVASVMSTCTPAGGTFVTP